MFITQPIKGLALKGTFHYDVGFYYWRNVDNRILLGGARNQDFEGKNTTELNTTDKVQQALKAFLYKHINLPEQDLRINDSWSGIMGFTQSKRPEIQMLQPNVWTVVACNGMGVALTPVMAEQTATQMMG